MVLEREREGERESKREDRFSPAVSISIAPIWVARYDRRFVFSFREKVKEIRIRPNLHTGPRVFLFARKERQSGIVRVGATSGVLNEERSVAYIRARIAAT